MNTDKCPTCNAPAKMTWSGLDLVAESGDETLASKHYEYQPNGNNTLLAVSGQLITKIEEDICDELSYLPNAGVTPNGVSLVAFDSVVEIVRKAFKAACASGAVDTATCGVDDNGWHCLLFEQGKLDSPCKAGCVHARSSCEG